MKSKKEIRSYIKKLFTQIDKEELLFKSIEIKNIVIQHILSHTYKDICIYEGMADEVETADLILELRDLGYNIYTPQIISEIEMMLIDANYDIYEEKIDLFIVPGRAFSTDGKRLGRGKGYYDRFLEKKEYKNSSSIGICFDCQILEYIPTEKHDKNVNLIISNASESRQ